MSTRGIDRALALVALGVALLVACEQDDRGERGETLTAPAPIPVVASVTVTPSDTTMEPGQTTLFTVTPRDASGNTLAGRAVSWASGNTSVATVSNTGQVAAVAPGSTTITASVEGKTATAAMTVKLSVNAVELVFTVQPTDAGVGLLITPAIQVTARNRLGETATDFAGEVQVTLGANPGAADLIGASNITANAGVATFTNLRVSQEGSGYTLVASASGLSAASKAFDVAPEAVTGQIAFVRSTHGIGHIYIMNTDGSAVTRLTNDVADQSGPAWSPDGAKVAFSGIGDGRSQIFVVNADGSGLVRLTTDTRRGDQPTWSPDGSRIAFSRESVGGSEICVMNADGSDSRVIFSGEFDVDNWAPAWSPDGSKIAFVWTNHLWSNIYVMRSDGSGAQPIVVQQNSETDVWAPAWAPDGGHILFWSGWGAPGFTLVASNGLGATKVSGNVAARGYARVNWSPRGTRIVFEGATKWANGSDIYIMKANGSGTVRLTSDGLSSQPAWRPRRE